MDPTAAYLSASRASAVDPEWADIVAAKDDMLRAKEAAVAQLKADMAAREQEMAARIRRAAKATQQAQSHASAIAPSRMMFPQQQQQQQQHREIRQATSTGYIPTTASAAAMISAQQQQQQQQQQQESAAPASAYEWAATQPAPATTPVPSSTLTGVDGTKAMDDVIIETAAAAASELQQQQQQQSYRPMFSDSLAVLDDQAEPTTVADIDVVAPASAASVATAKRTSAMLAESASTSSSQLPEQPRWARMAEVLESEAKELRRQMRAADEAVQAAKATAREANARRKAAEAMAYSLQQSEAARCAEVEAWQREARGLEARIMERDERLAVLEAAASSAEVATSKAEAMERYIRDLPTADEYAAQCEAAAESQRRCDSYREANDLAEVDLKQQKRQIERQQAQLETLNAENDDLRAGLLRAEKSKAQTTHELKTLCNTLTAERDAVREHYTDVTRQLSEMTASCERLQQQLADQSAVHDAASQRNTERDGLVAELQARLAESGGEVKRLERKLSDGEETRASLLRKVKAQATTIRELRTAFSSLTDQNQQLIAQNQRLRAGMDPGRDIGPLELPQNYLTPTETDKLQDELAESVTELQDVVQLALSRLHGSSPHLAVMLGLDGGSGSGSGSGGGGGGSFLVRTSDFSSQLETVRELRKELRVVRDQIANKYASDVGRDACAVQ